MPIERYENDLKLYYAIKNEDGTVEFQTLEKCKTIEIVWTEQE